MHSQSSIITPGLVAMVALLGAAGSESESSPVEMTPVQTIAGPEITVTGHSIDDATRTIAKLRVRQRPQVGLPGDPAASVQWLIDGVLVPGEAVGVIPATLIERVEVLKEGAGPIYGKDAINGVINIVTAPDAPVGVPEPQDARPSDIGYAFTGIISGIYVSAEYLTGCDVSAGLSRPFWTFTGGEPFGGPLLRDSTWYLRRIPVDFAPDNNWQVFGAPGLDYDGTFRPFVLAGPQPPEAVAAALGEAPPASARVSAFPAEMFRGGIPPESVVLRSDACPPEIRARLTTLYAERDQARADMVYWNDFRSGFRDPAKAREARERLDQTNQQIRALLDECGPPTVTAPPETAVATATPTPAARVPRASLRFDVRADYGRFGTGRPAAGAALDLSPRLNLNLPWTGPKLPDLYAGAGPVRIFTDPSGQALTPLDLNLVQQLGVTPNQFETFGQLARKYRWFGFDDGAPPQPGKAYFDLGMTNDGHYDVGIRLPLIHINSQIVELGGTRSNVALGPGNGLVPDPRLRFQPLLEQDDPKMPIPIQPYFADAFNIGNRTFFVFNYPVTAGLSSNSFVPIRGRIDSYENACADAALPVPPDDPGYRTAADGGGSWGQPYDDQWAIKRVGFTADQDSAWSQVPERPAPVVIGVIDTGLDWHHADLDWESLWRNPREIPGNGLDDDNNGYVDDVIGWDFLNNDNRPWDHDGHGTFVAGIIGASRNNATGIAGINPHAKIMVLKALNTFGRTRASYLAKAIAYGADNGAQILNLSVAGPGLPPIVQEAIRYATSKGVLVVVAAGNTGDNVSEVFPAGAAGALVVAAIGPDDRRPSFSNWGPGISVAAPGVDVMSLRARRTDFMWNTGDASVYRPGANVVGADRRYYRATGTSFAAPIVSGVASLVWARNPSLNAADVRRILEQSAEDVETPGRDQYTGYGVVDARAALAADPRFFVEAAIRAVTPVQRGRDVVLEVFGTADADRFEVAWLELGEGENPQRFRRVGPELTAAVADGKVGEVAARDLTGQSVWTLRLVTRHRDGRLREARFLLTVG